MVAVTLVEDKLTVVWCTDVWSPIQGFCPDFALTPAKLINK